jgi:hypothetical protein
MPENAKRGGESIGEKSRRRVVGDGRAALGLVLAGIVLWLTLLTLLVFRLL